MYIPLHIVLRTFVALLTQGFFQPDEYFQSLEPAHRLVYGYGHLTWEWLSPRPIRSFVFPALNVPVYWALRTLGLDESHPSLVIFLPRLLQGFLASATDATSRVLARQIFGDRYASMAYFLSMTSFFHFLALSRSLSNSLETTLSTLALSYYPWHVLATSAPEPPSAHLCILFSALACLVRPTNGVLWFYLYGILLFRLRRRSRAFFSVLRTLIIIGISSLLLAFAVDSSYYGMRVLTPLNFICVNASPVSLFYGSSPWHYYLSQGLPILCTTSLPFVLHGMWLSTRGSNQSAKILLGCVLWTVSIYSLAGHKEWRFIHPILPMLHVFASKSLVDLWDGQRKQLQRTGKKVSSYAARLPICKSHLYILLLTIPASIFVIFFHCTGQIKVMTYLRDLPADDLKSVGFLMPCHSTPWQAYLHRPELAEHGKMWALGCEPPLNLDTHTASYKDQTDIFFESPQKYIREHFPPAVDPSFPPSPFPSSIPGSPLVARSGGGKDAHGAGNPWVMDWRHEWPQYLVLFGDLLAEEGVRDLLEEQLYSEVWKGGFEWEGEGRRKGAVRVWKHSAR
ncbi:glycosyltransferase family 22 protein [Coniophora puteana RWD-64-598 SS2]|uniref:Mannosyltransferase n=1 Tax=Coniophora puteana (strain RWD-64-598) TaxID=741705 RepID=A0A5M3N0I8_CONPW|nr:glycosyltransferase family 22 protein [Coniophora puteana RWD-64-598 SS2]EIW84933.1 glycosyltransferase family 22 protein [Coniophora puteana RWD-64-598 SS2]